MSPTTTLHFIFLRQGLPSSLEFTNLARLDDQRALEVPLFSPLRHWDYTRPFTWVLEDELRASPRTSTFYLLQVSLLPGLEELVN